VRTIRWLTLAMWIAPLWWRNVSIYPAHCLTWTTAIGPEPCTYGTHSLRRTNAAEIYRKTGNVRAVQRLLGDTRVDRIVRYPRVELEDALSIAQQFDI